MKLILFPSVTDVRGREFNKPWPEFAQGYLNTHVPQLSKDGELYAGAVYESGNIVRGDSNTIGRTAIVFDIDNKDCPITRPEDHLTNLEGLTWAWHSTWSSTPEKPKFRIVIPLDRMVTPEEWPAVYRSAWALIGNDPAVDSGSADLSRAYYRPAYHPSRKGTEFAGYIDGAALSADEMLDAGGSSTVIPLRPVPVHAVATVPTGSGRKYDGRNDALKSQVAACLAKGKGIDDTVRELIEFDQRMHTPPLFSDPGENRGKTDPWTNALRFVSSNIDSINQRRMAAGETPQGHGVTPHGALSELPVIWWKDRGITLDTHDFVEGLLNDGTMSVIYGDSNVGKSFFILDVGLHVGLGVNWQGREVEQGGVIYVAAEGGFLFQNRLEAFARHYQVKARDVPFAIVPCGIDLRSNEADTDRLIELIEGAAAQIKVPVRLVIIDTLARAMAGGNENSSEDMGALVINSDKIRAVTGAHLSFIHHSGKDQAKGARGHSSLRAATDTEIEIVKSETGMSVTAVKQRDMEMGHIMHFALKSIDLGVNKRGKPVTSCVILPLATIDMVPDTKGLGKNQAQALRVLEEMYQGAYEEMEKRGQGREAAKIEVSYFQSELAELGVLGRKTEYHKQQFHRIKEGLLERNIIRLEGGFVYILIK